MLEKHVFLRELGELRGKSFFLNVLTHVRTSFYTLLNGLIFIRNHV